MLPWLKPADIVLFGSTTSYTVGPGFSSNHLPVLTQEQTQCKLMFERILLADSKFYVL